MEKVYQTLGTPSIFHDILYSWHGFNKTLFMTINSIRGETYNAWMQIITRIGEHELFPYYITAIACYAIVALTLRKIARKPGGRYHAAMWFGIVVVLVAGYVVDGLAVRVMKLYFSLPRPYVVLDHEKIAVWEPATLEEAYLSFPSGHASFITMMLAGLWPALSVPFRILGVALVAAVCWSRVAVGMHFPADVLWGAFIAAVIVLALRSVIYAQLRRFGINP